MSQKRAYKQYPKAFKEEAVALVLEQGYSVAEAAKSLGIASNILYKWKDKVEGQLNGKALNTRRHFAIFHNRNGAVTLTSSYTNHRHNAYLNGKFGKVPLHNTTK